MASKILILENVTNQIWSPLPLPEGSRITSNWMRKIYSHQEYMYMILRNESVSISCVI